MTEVKEGLWDFLRSVLSFPESLRTHVDPYRQGSIGPTNLGSHSTDPTPKLGGLSDSVSTG